MPPPTKATAVEAHKSKFGGGPPLPNAQSKDNPAELANYDYDAWVLQWAVDSKDVYSDGGGRR